MAKHPWFQSQVPKRKYSQEIFILGLQIKEKIRAEVYLTLCEFTRNCHRMLNMSSIVLKSAQEIPAKEEGSSYGNSIYSQDYLLDLTLMGLNFYSVKGSLQNSRKVSLPITKDSQKKKKLCQPKENLNGSTHPKYGLREVCLYPS